ncbi:MAG TPA: glycosyltransferase [Stellaceae bacterium]|nr:glycosyltransferase [Stellaceae bacterium]
MNRVAFLALARRADAMLRYALLPVALPLVVLAACVARALTMARRAAGKRPRNMWGPVPLVSNIYAAKALRRYGYRTASVVCEGDRISAPTKFDLYLPTSVPSGTLKDILRYAYFVHSLFAFDVMWFLFVGGFLGLTPLRRIEMQLLHLAGKRMILMPFGSDIAIPEYLGPFRDSMMSVDPALAARAPSVRRNVLYYSRHADFVIRNFQVGFLPRHDAFVPNFIAIDMELWSPNRADAARAKPPDAEIVVVHASNHRAIKGTDEIIAAVESLRDEGVAVRMSLIEGQSNDAVRAAVQGADVVVEQLICGYAMFGVEGMAAGKPVLSNMEWVPPEMRAGSCIADCPIVSTTKETIKENLRAIVTDAEMRRRLGAASRQYVEKHHSLESVGAIFDAIVRHVWNDEALPSFIRKLPASA